MNEREQDLKRMICVELELNRNGLNKAQLLVKINTKRNYEYTILDINKMLKYLVFINAVYGVGDKYYLTPAVRRTE